MILFDTQEPGRYDCWWEKNYINVLVQNVPCLDLQEMSCGGEGFLVLLERPG